MTNQKPTLNFMTTPGVITRWKRAQSLNCSYVRGEGRGEFFHWLAIEKDPCEQCDNTTCHSSGKEFNDSIQLIILRAWDFREFKNEQHI